MQPELLSGLILVNKPQGLTSFQTVQRVCKLLKVKKAGHAGTLDRFATGLLLICLGRSTRLLQFLTGLSKSYHAVIALGSQTDTDDPEGTVINSYSGPMHYELIKEKARLFTGTIRQIPPDYSAVHINGTRAYIIARKDTKPDLKEREVQVNQFILHDFSPPLLKVEISCSSGTYIRSIARDLGLATGYYAHVQDLQRSAVDNYQLTSAASLDEIQQGAYRLISPYHILESFPSLQIKPDYIYPLTLGKIPLGDWFINFDKTSENGYYRVHNNEELLAVLEKKGPRLQYKLVY